MTTDWLICSPWDSGPGTWHSCSSQTCEPVASCTPPSHLPPLPSLPYPEAGGYNLSFASSHNKNTIAVSPWKHHMSKELWFFSFSHLKWKSTCSRWKTSETWVLREFSVAPSLLVPYHLQFPLYSFSEPNLHTRYSSSIASSRKPLLATPACRELSAPVPRLCPSITHSSMGARLSLRMGITFFHQTANSQKAAAAGKQDLFLCIWKYCY